MGKSRRRALLGLAALGAAALAVGGGAAPSPATPAEHYVALGDSYTSGPGIPRQVDADCARSDRNYPSLTARALGVASFTDVSCGGATTADMWRPQRGNPPQLTAVSKDTTLVTVQIGGNDIGFGEIMSTCGRLGAADPAGAPCTAHYTGGGTDVLADRVEAAAPLVGKVLDAVHERSPRARVYVLGYPPILPESGPGCWPVVAAATGDVPYMRATAKRLNAMLREVAGDSRARYVDTYAPAVGHDACRPPAERWTEPLVPASPAAPLHPNAAGERAMADALLARLAEPGRGR
ncbi:SGNH/GDSL hydrolase family protein [Streptomyces chilikensis]|uniref:SGNH/GDSL hydrolase family protein n=1 Tax=Streptomyces chilikensis TaxID=1194079 RepID=UPI00140BCED6|nr:SGNH/GDSL hydrolase family protein [Streptomyces chilikensis]